MKKYLLALCSFFLLAYHQSGAQCLYSAASNGSDSAVTFTLSGASFQSYGCSPIDPNYWVSGNGAVMTATFTTLQSSPSFRVWGMNDDDSASVFVNGVAYPLNSSSASFDPKVTCGTSPGPDGVTFANGNLTGANANGPGNFSYQNITLITDSVSSITVKGLSGAGWGYVGVTYDCVTFLSVPGDDEQSIGLFPNPTSGKVFITAPKLPNASITITNELGQCLANQIAQGNSFDLSGNPSGVYFITIHANGQKATRRIVKI